MKSVIRGWKLWIFLIHCALIWKPACLAENFFSLLILSSHSRNTPYYPPSFLTSSSRIFTYFLLYYGSLVFLFLVTWPIIIRRLVNIALEQTPLMNNNQQWARMRSLLGWKYQTTSQNWKARVSLVKILEREYGRCVYKWENFLGYVRKIGWAATIRASSYKRPFSLVWKNIAHIIWLPLFPVEISCGKSWGGRECLYLDCENYWCVIKWIIT